MERGVSQTWRRLQKGEALPSFIHIFCDTMYVQSCGLCDGDTPHESNTDCYDTVDDGCEEVAKNSCYRNKEVCKKVRLHNDKRTYMRG